MSYSEAQELINRSLDGDIDTAGQQRLDQLLRDDEAVRKDYESSAALFDLLQRVPVQAPQSDISASVAAALEGRAATPPVSPAPDARPATGNVMKARFGQRWKPALAMAASLVAAVAVVLVVDNNPAPVGEQEKEVRLSVQMANFL